MPRKKTDEETVENGAGEVTEETQATAEENAGAVMPAPALEVPIILISGDRALIARPRNLRLDQSSTGYMPPNL